MTLMMKYLYLLPFLMLIISCESPSTSSNDVIEVIKDYSELQARLDSDTSKIWVVNFWATTCPPCIKEMPHFKELQAKFPEDELKVLLVSTDRPKDHEERVLPFIKKHDITPETMHLIDENYSAWTDKIDPSWFGALPATLIINGSKRNFKFGMYEHFKDLEKDVISVR